MRCTSIFLVLIVLFFNILSVRAEDEKSSAWGDNSSVFDTGFENQEAVSNTKLKKTIDAIKQNALSRKQRKIQNDVKPLSPMSDFEHLNQFANSQDPDNELSQTLTVMIPVSAYSSDGKAISPGYYKLSCRKIDNNDYVLDLSQGNTIFLTVKAEHTTQDLEQETISFCNSEIISNNRIRLMYGSIDLNLVAYLYFD